MGTEQFQAAARTASPLIAATTPNQRLQAAIAAERPDLHAALAANPALYPELREWLAEVTRRTAAEAAGHPGTGAPDCTAAQVVEAAGDDAGAAGTDAEAAGAAAGGQQAGQQAEPDGSAPGAQAPGVRTAETTFLPVSAPMTPDGVAGADHSWDGRGVSPQPVSEAPTQVVAPTRVAAVQQVPSGALPPVQPAAVQQAPSRALPPVQPAASPAEGKPRRRRLWLILLICLIVLALVGAAVFLLRRGDHPTAAAPSVPAGPSVAASATATASVTAPAPPTASATQVTRCPNEPSYEVLAVRDRSGSLEVDVRVTPSCKDGDVLSGASNLVTLSGPLKGASLSSSTRVVAAVAVFDLSRAPVAVPASGTGVTFVFEPSFSYVSAAQIAVDRATLSVARDQSGETGATTAAGPLRLDTASAPDAATMDTIWLGLLRSQADADSATVSGPLDGTWVPQLSSKKPGLVLDGTTWDAGAVWEHYLRLKATFPNAILLYSDDWSVFDAGGHWWVVAVAEPFATAEEANAWCDAHGLSKDDCFAKYLKVGGSSEGTTVLR